MQIACEKSKKEWVTEMYFASKRLPQKETKSGICGPVNEYLSPQKFLLFLMTLLMKLVILIMI